MAKFSMVSFVADTAWTRVAWGSLGCDFRPLKGDSNCWFDSARLLVARPAIMTGKRPSWEAIVNLVSADFL